MSDTPRTDKAKFRGAATCSDGGGVCGEMVWASFAGMLETELTVAQAEARSLAVRECAERAEYYYLNEIRMGLFQRELAQLKEAIIAVDKPKVPVWQHKPECDYKDFVSQFNVDTLCCFRCGAPRPEAS